MDYCLLRVRAGELIRVSLDCVRRRHAPPAKWPNPEARFRTKTESNEQRDTGDGTRQIRADSERQKYERDQVVLYRDLHTVMRWKPGQREIVTNNECCSLIRIGERRVTVSFCFQRKSFRMRNDLSREIDIQIRPIKVSGFWLLDI